MKEPGQMAWEAYSKRVQTLTGLQWGQIAPDRKLQWAAVETAVRNAALEEAAKIMAERAAMYRVQADEDEADMTDRWTNTERAEFAAEACKYAEAAIRALKREKTPDAEAPGQVSSGSPPGPGKGEPGEAG